MNKKENGSKNVIVVGEVTEKKWKKNEERGMDWNPSKVQLDINVEDVCADG